MSHEEREMSPGSGMRSTVDRILRSAVGGRTLCGMPDPASAVLSWLMTPGIGEQLPSLEDLARRPTWMKRAACVGQPIELFFPARGVSAATMARARAICAGCSVRAECLDYVTVNTMGVWGGTTERERRGMRVVA